jgi:hypothetical protein
METSLKLNQFEELNVPLFKHLIKDLISVYGSIEITIKPQYGLNSELINRIKSIESGEEMISFSVEEFEKFTNDILDGKKPNVDTLKKVKMDEKGNIIPSISL